MKYILHITLLSLALAAAAQDQLPERLLISTGQHLGPGARAQGMAGTYTGIADDFSAVWWNPAGLAQVKRIELQASLARSGYANDTDYFGSPYDGETSGTRINDIGMVFPVPVYQGALSFAVGYAQAAAFDRRTRVDGSGSGGNSGYDWFDELESGRLGFWTLAGAVDVSPNLALGMGLQYWTGRDEYSFIGEEFAVVGLEEQTIDTDMRAFGANVGGLFRAGRFARVGVTYQTPMSMKFEENWQFNSDDGYIDYRMTFPAVYRLGASVSPGRWLAAADLEYRDWTAMEFRGHTPFTDVSEAEANRQIKDDYQSTTRLSLGGEYLFPAFGTRARAGYSFAPSNFRNSGGEDDRSIFTLGVGVLVDRSVMLDAAYHMTSYTEKVTDGLTEDIRSSAAVLTVSYRL